MDVRQQLAIFRRSARLLIASGLLAGLAAFLVSGHQRPEYEAKTALIVGQSLTGANPDYNALLVSERLSRTYATITTTRATLERVIADLHLTDTADELGKRVTASAAGDVALITITARDADPRTAADVANALAAELIATSPGGTGESEFEDMVRDEIVRIQSDIRTTEAEIDRLRSDESPSSQDVARLAGLEDRLTSLRSNFAGLLAYSSDPPSNYLSVVEPAVPPEAPVAPRPLLSALLAALVGLMAASAIAFIAEYLDDTVRDPTMVQERLGLPTLGITEAIPTNPKPEQIYNLVTLVYPRASAAEAYRTLRTNVEFASVDTPVRNLVVTSSVPGEGKTVTAGNLAVTFAQSGRRVLLVDADLRHPGVHDLFRMQNGVGLMTMVRTEGWSPEGVIQRTEEETLDVLTTGPIPPNPAEILTSQRIRTIVERLQARYDLLIFDSPPLVLFADAAVLSSSADGAILVVRQGRTHRAETDHSREALTKAGARILGVVLAGATKASTAVYPDYFRSDQGGTAGGRPVVANGLAGARPTDLANDRFGRREGNRP